MKTQRRAVPLRLLPAGDKGLGVFASRAIPAGHDLLRFEGPLLEPQEVPDPARAIQVAGGRFLGSSGGLDDYPNHSCDPSCYLQWRRDALWLVSLRRLEPSEELTFDYSTCMVDEPALEPCRCGAARCRGRVVTYHELPESLRRDYERRGVVPDYVASARPAARRRPRTGQRRPGPPLRTRPG